MIFVDVVYRAQLNRAWNADHAARTCERFVYSIVKITRLYDYQTWQNIVGEIHEVRKGLWTFLLIAMLIGWAGKS